MARNGDTGWGFADGVQAVDNLRAPRVTEVDRGLAVLAVQRLAPADSELMLAALGLDDVTAVAVAS